MTRPSFNEDRLAGRIDRNRTDEGNTARSLQIREMARATVTCAAKEYEGRERLTFLRSAAHTVRDMFATEQDEAGAVALFGSLAWSAELRVGRAVAAANAEKVFRPANDGEQS